MGLFNTHLVKFRPELDYMTRAERVVFDRMRGGASLSFFRVKVCDREGCDQETPKHKAFCSKRCYDIVQARSEDEQEGDGSVD